MGHERYIGTTVLRVRSLGYTGRDPGMARTSLLSHEPPLQMTELDAFGEIFSDIRCRIDELPPKPTPA